MSAKWETSPWRARRSVSLRLTCISHHVGKRSAEQGRQDEVRTALAGNTALGAFHETRVMNHGSYGSTVVRHFLWSERGFHQRFSRITNPETRITAFFRNTSLTPLRCAEGAPCGEKAELKVVDPKPKSDATPPCPPSSHGLPARHWLAFLLPGHGFPGGCFPLFPVISRGVGGAPEQVFKRRSRKSRKSVQNPASPRKMREAQRPPPLPSPSGLVPFAANGTHAEKGERSTLRRSGRILLDSRFNWTYD